MCNKGSARFCPRCKSARYCWIPCQLDDWPTHKLLCAIFSNFDASSRPTDQHFRAIFFPVDDRKPRVVWLQGEWEDDEKGGRYQHNDVNSYFGPDTTPRHFPIQYNPILKKELSDTVYVCHGDVSQINRSKANKSVASITATKTGQNHDWRGPIIAYGTVGLDTVQNASRDINMTDFRHVADFFLSYCDTPTYTPKSASEQPPAGKMVLGVRINCVGDRGMLNKPRFEAVEVPCTDTIFSKHDTSDVAERIGLPIFTQRCSPDPRWADDECLFENTDATFLHQCCDPKSVFEPLSLRGSMGWGLASRQWQDNVGSTLVVRQDKKPLSPLHVEALCKYCREVRPLFGHSMGEYYPEEPMSKDAVLAMICRATFVISWYKLTGEKEGADLDVPYPYDV
ncbi:hypothetical protein MMC07_007050 [Pseudocyphellaria aurata]|nr:hypothetical protein [Pseudocyphellaria aurata]